MGEPHIQLGMICQENWLHFPWILKTCTPYSKQGTDVDLEPVPAECHGFVGSS